MKHTFPSMTDTQELVVPKSIPITSPPAGLELIWEKVKKISQVSNDKEKVKNKHPSKKNHQYLKALGPTAHLLEKIDALEPWGPFKWVEA